MNSSLARSHHYARRKETSTTSVRSHSHPDSRKLDAFTPDNIAISLLATGALLCSYNRPGYGYRVQPDRYNKQDSPKPSGKFFSRLDTVLALIRTIQLGQMVRSRRDLGDVAAGLIRFLPVRLFPQSARLYGKEKIRPFVSFVATLRLTKRKDLLSLQLPASSYCAGEAAALASRRACRLIRLAIPATFPRIFSLKKEAANPSP